MAEKKKVMYVNNEELFQHLSKRRLFIAEELAAGRPKPTLQNDNYLGKVIWDVAEHLSYRPNFINYTFKHDMISDAVENLVRFIDNFDPAKSRYPFAYMTTIAWQAFVRRIQREEKEQIKKGMLISEMMIDDMFDSQEHDEDGISYKTHFIEYLRENNFIGADTPTDTPVVTIKTKLPEKKDKLELFYDESEE